MSIIEKIKSNIENILTRKITLILLIILVSTFIINTLHRNINNDFYLILFLVSIPTLLACLIFYSWKNRTHLNIFAFWFLFVSIGVSLLAFILSIIIYVVFKSILSFKSIVLIFDIITFIILLMIMYYFIKRYESDKNYEGYFNYALYATGAIYIIVGYYLPIYAKIGNFTNNATDSVMGIIKVIADSDDWKMDKGVLLELFAKIASYPLLAVNGVLKMFFEYQKTNAQKKFTSDNTSLFMHSLLVNVKNLLGLIFNLFKMKTGKILLLSLIIPIMFIITNPSYNQHYKVIHSYENLNKASNETLNRTDLTPYEKKIALELQQVDNLFNGAMVGLGYQDFYFFSITRNSYKNGKILTVGYLNKVYPYETSENNGRTLPLTKLVWILIAIEAILGVMLIGLFVNNLIKPTSKVIQEDEKLHNYKINENLIKFIIGASFILCVLCLYSLTNPYFSPMARIFGCVAITCLPWIIFAIIKPKLATLYITSSRITAGLFFFFAAIIFALVGAYIPRI